MEGEMFLWLFLSPSSNTSTFHPSRDTTSFIFVYVPSFRFPTRIFPIFFFFNDTATTEIYTLSLHDALPILLFDARVRDLLVGRGRFAPRPMHEAGREDRKSTRLNSSHVRISYAVFCLKKKKAKGTASIREAKA